MTTHDSISEHLKAFLKSPRVLRLAQSYHCDPQEALGEIWLRLSHQLQHTKVPIRDIAKWIQTNGYFVLWTYVRKESRYCLQQSEGEP
jgi:hypothetical protein